jgi:imidazolonepropionase-like amidohydrolase
MLKPRVVVALASVWAILACGSVNAQDAAGNAQRVSIGAARLIDGKSQAAVSNRVVPVEGDKITAVGPGLTIPRGAKVIDLGDATFLP